MSTKVILVTGAGSGIGQATARRLSGEGHTLCLMGRNRAKLEALQLPGSIHICDVRDADAVRAEVNAIQSTHGRIDAVVNNAGLGYFNPIAEAPLAEWHEMVDVNVKGALNVIHACLPHLMASGGHLINIASVGGHNVFANSGVYCATKHALLAISEGLRLELSGKINVTTISPGPVATPFIEQTKNPRLLSEYKDYFAAGLQPDTVARQIAYALTMAEDGVVSEIIIRPKRVER
jgi:NADP-dependent 3-hydroxy acid dehydrogenase YdfG